MPDENSPSAEELWNMVKTFSQHARDLQKQIEVEQEKNAALNTENSEWLKIYQRHLSEISELKDEITRLESQIRAAQGEP